MSDLAASLAALAESLDRTGVTKPAAGGGTGTSLDVTEILAMPLDRFEREGQCLEIRVPWLDVTLWFVPDERDAAALWRDGVSRGRVWTARELFALMTLPDRTSAIVRRLALAKIEVDGEISDVRPREPRGPHEPAGSGCRPGEAQGGQS